MGVLFWLLVYNRVLEVSARTPTKTNLTSNQENEISQQPQKIIVKNLK